MPDPINYLVTDVQLKAIADKIRSKTGGSSNIQFVDEFVSEIEKLTDTRDANATASDILSGKTAYVNKQKVTGSIPSQGSVVVYPSGLMSSGLPVDSVYSGSYLSGNIYAAGFEMVGSFNGTITGRTEIDMYSSGNAKFTISPKTGTIGGRTYTAYPIFPTYINVNSVTNASSYMNILVKEITCDLESIPNLGYTPYCSAIQLELVNNTNVQIIFPANYHLSTMTFYCLFVFNDTTNVP